MLDSASKEAEMEIMLVVKGVVVFAVLGCVAEAGVEVVMAEQCVVEVVEVVEATGVLRAVLEAISVLRVAVEMVLTV